MTNGNTTAQRTIAPLRPRIIAEFVGTFALVFAGTGAIVADQLTGGAVGHVGISLTFGLVIGVMVYAYKDVSGAQYNPAVSLALLTSRRQTVQEALIFILTQLAASTVASATLWLLFGGSGGVALDFGATVPNRAVGAGVGQALVLEVTTTFFLVSVIFGVIREKDKSNAWAGLAIGGTVALCALFAGTISGASMNPARSFGPALFTAGALSAYWIYGVGPIFGGLLAVAVDYGVRNG